MNAFNSHEGSLQTHWDHQKDLAPEGPVNGVPQGRLERIADELMHWTDVSGEKVFLVIHGEAPELPHEDLMRLADQMETALLNERANRLPIY